MSRYFLGIILSIACYVYRAFIIWRTEVPMCLEIFPPTRLNSTTLTSTLYILSTTEYYGPRPVSVLVIC
ncbi:hypothetical protein L208DRAFT_1413941 [Tricholoma matsutake]|nr:hypothetical protein L208DRAFT_1413941 [Tricholoma matsutake 945]